jgi:hypothetical protein
MRTTSRLLFGLGVLLATAAVVADDGVVRLAAEDTLRVTVDDAAPAAAGVLRGLAWDPGPFEVAVQMTPGRDYDAAVTFDSPRPSGDAELDRVVLRWYRPRVREGSAPSAGRAVLVVHTLHPELPVATMLARGLRQRGVHAFLLELPGYASRVGAERRMTGVTTLLHAAQAVGDCRRAADAIAALARTAPLPGRGYRPLPPGAKVSVQGTSLGSFIATSAAALDGRFAQTFLFLSGGDGADILENGQKDAFHVRNALRHYGYQNDATLRELIATIEPLTIAHRLDPATTWMFSARDDTVVPARNARLLADAIGLPPAHHVWMPGNHYTAFILLPGVLDQIAAQVQRPPAVDD